ncbi:cytochrome P450 [Emcibacter sp. SYSU 3D8]|uniref:cytochrome P450 n=1 Tax=Emcibacter sp. SYSU 3D8 TaxID=3133969 RepID=UPI0031FE7670
MSTMIDYCAIADPSIWADERGLLALLDDMRRNAPVAWVEPPGFRPFWAISRHADIMELERQSDRFLNGPRAVLQSIDQEEAVRAFTGGSDQLLRTLIHMDNPDHRIFRAMTQEWFQPRSLGKLQQRITELAKRTVDRMAQSKYCDFVADVAVWYPLQVIMMILGAPESDEPLLLKLTQELFGPQDPDMQRQEADAPDMGTVQQFFAYFSAMTDARRANPRDDVATVIANATIDGRPIGHLEAMSYYIIIATAGHDTTSSATSGGLLALMRNPWQLARLRDDPALIPSAVDEMFRWTTPVKHFMRTATEDYTLRGQNIRKGDALMLLYHAANRDEEVFEAPNEFRVDRSPNRHIAFGYGPHLCLGQYLAKMEMRALFTELVPRLEHVELDGYPAWVQSSFVSGLKRLPIRYVLTDG